MSTVVYGVLIVDLLTLGVHLIVGNGAKPARVDAICELAGGVLSNSMTPTHLMIGGATGMEIRRRKER